MIRVYFLFEDPNDETGVNLSYIDVPTNDPRRAILSVEYAAESGELWENMYPDEDERPYTLIRGKTMFLDVSSLPREHRLETTLRA